MRVRVDLESDALYFRISEDEIEAVSYTHLEPTRPY